MDKLLLEVIKDIRPDKEYENNVLGKANDIIKKINKNINGAKAILGGSGAKGTWLKTFDADIFVKFSYDKYNDKMSSLENERSSFLAMKKKKRGNCIPFTPLSFVLIP